MARNFVACLLLLAAQALVYGNGEQLPAVGYGAPGRGLKAVCTLNSDCDDNIPCTKNRCINGVCDFTQLTCSTRDRCSKAACVLDGTSNVCGIVPKCAPSTNKCQSVKCQRNSGTCITENKVCPAVSPANQCLASTGCDSVTGSCLYSTTVRVCPASTNLCLIPSVCSPTTGCTFTAKTCTPSTDPCATNVCNPTTGACTQVPIVCNARGPCQTGTCVAGVCNYTPKCPSVIPTNLCVTQLCRPRDGTCYSVPKCNDNKQCTTDTCNPLDGSCTFTSTCRNGPCCRNGRCPSFRGRC